MHHIALRGREGVREGGGIEGMWEGVSYGREGVCEGVWMELVVYSIEEDLEEEVCEGSEWWLWG